MVTSSSFRPLLICQVQVGTDPVSSLGDLHLIYQTQCFLSLLFAQTALSAEFEHVDMNITETDLVSLGLIGQTDPVRPQAEDALAMCALRMS